jgi:hypothetical protein
MSEYCTINIPDVSSYTSNTPEYTYIEGLGQVRIFDPNVQLDITDTVESGKTQTKLLYKKTNVVQFFDEFSNLSQSQSQDLTNIPHYNTTIDIELKQYADGKRYYYISYNYKFVPSANYSKEINLDMKKKAHPFFQFKHIEKSSYEGDIVFCNEMTTQMIEYLLLDDNELEKKTGTTTAQQYRKTIMSSLALLWD